MEKARYPSSRRPIQRQTFMRGENPALTHVLLCTSILAPGERNSSLYDSFLSRTGFYLDGSGQSEAEKQILITAIIILEQEVGFTHPAVGLLLAALAVLYLVAQRRSNRENGCSDGHS